MPPSDLLFGFFAQFPFLECARASLLCLERTNSFSFKFSLGDFFIGLFRCHAVNALVQFGGGRSCSWFEVYRRLLPATIDESTSIKTIPKLRSDNEFSATDKQKRKARELFASEPLHVVKNVLIVLHGVPAAKGFGSIK